MISIALGRWSMHANSKHVRRRIYTSRGWWTPFVKAQERLSAPEALFGFCGWLTTREQPTTMSSTHNAAPIADLISSFVQENNLSEPREEWHNYVRHPD